MKKTYKHELNFRDREELLQYIIDNPYANASRREGREYGKSFCEYSWQDTLDMLRYGWSKGIQEVDIKVKEITSIVDSQEIVYDRGVTGDFLDIGTYLQGLPECWLYQDHQPCKKEVIKVTVNIGALAKVTQEQIYNKGAVVMSVLDRLYQSHYLDIDIVSYVPNFSDYHSIKITYSVNTLNGYDRDMLVFMLCNSAYLRRVIFSCREKITEIKHINMYGGSKNITIKEGIYFPCLNGSNCNSYNTLEMAIDNVSSVLAGIGNQA